MELNAKSIRIAVMLVLTFLSCAAASPGCSCDAHGEAPHSVTSSK